MSAARYGLRNGHPAKLLLIAFVAAVAFSACGDLTQSTQQPVGDNAREIQELFMPILWIAVAIFVLVQGYLIYSIVRFRRRSDSDPIPVQVHGDARLEAVWTLAPAVIVIALAVMTFRTIAAQAQDPPADALRVNVVGHQWWWEFEYPDLGIETANELWVPVGRTIDLTIESTDVIHSFWFPQIAGKIDAVPGKTNRIHFTVPLTAAGNRYQGQCAEFCGFAHAQMKMLLFAASEENFDNWVAAMKSMPSAASEAMTGAEIFSARCNVCHSIRGKPAIVDPATPGACPKSCGPNLTGLGMRTMIGAAHIENTDENLTAWITDPNEVKPGVYMPALGLSVSETADVVAYLQSMN